ncbi:MAG: HPr family phosphocarrier protein [Oscillospiraceae bacterium]|jgi:phosphotransferase system HPr-like phosphotransfer protein|nr:HPr family phosphocarrier protein [Oscillospiraceae bacterium]
MTEVNIKLSTIDDVKKFVNIVFRYEYDVDVISGRYAVDAKSILGLFSIDLSKAVVMKIHYDNCDELLAEVKEFMV